MTDEASPLLGRLRQADGDRYLATLYAPQDRREALAALYLFNAEIAAVRDRVTQPIAGEMRLQWWRDTLTDSVGGGQGHDVAGPLLRAIGEHRLPASALDDMLAARVFDLYDDPMPSKTDLEGYCGETAGALIQLASLILDPVQAARFGAAAGHAGCAQAMTGLIRLMPLHRARGQCYVPAEILAACGLDAPSFLAGDAKAAHVVGALAALARQHLTAFVAGAKALPVSLRPAYLPLAPVPAYLDAIERDPGAALSRPAEIGSLRRHWLYLRRASRGW